jgi:hypothetical protein
MVPCDSLRFANFRETGVVVLIYLSAHSPNCKHALARTAGRSRRTARRTTIPPRCVLAGATMIDG